jgi:hypothetical protein
MFAIFKPSTVIEVSDYRNLVHSWRTYKRVHHLVGRWSVERLTKAQHKRLSRELKARLEVKAWA